MLDAPLMNEVQDEVKLQDDDEEKADEEPKEDNHPDTTAACRQCLSNMIRKNFQTLRCFDFAPKTPPDSSSPTTAILN
jgi:hypothetical protein